jgi:hypothetical protein
MHAADATPSTPGPAHARREQIVAMSREVLCEDPSGIEALSWSGERCRWEPSGVPGLFRLVRTVRDPDVEVTR